MENFIPYAESHNFILVIPEGLDNSFNAGDCCGYAKQHNIHDVDFIVYIQTHLGEEFYFVESEFSYGIGWSNGAFLLTFAMQVYPHLFRAIVPIAGYTHDFSSMEGLGIGMMMHHSLDDTNVRPSGCCADPALPKCHCGIEMDRCVSVLDVFDSWAREVNLCGETNDSSGITAGEAAAVHGNGVFGSGGVGGSSDATYSLSFQNDETIFSFAANTNDPPAAKSFMALTSTKTPVAITYNDRDRKITCITTTSSSCIANSTLCLYSNKGHFNNPNFGASFPMGSEAFDFISRDICGVNGGVWMVHNNGAKTFRVCDCSASQLLEYGGLFCLDALNTDGTYKTVPISSMDSSAPIEITVLESSSVSSPKSLDSLSQINPHPTHDKNQIVAIVAAVLLTMIVIVAAVVIHKRRQSHQQSFFNYGPHSAQNSKFQDNPLFYIERAGDKTGCGGYRDYFKSKTLSPVRHMYGTEILDRRSSELEEHRPPYAYNYETEMVGRHDAAPPRIHDSKQLKVHRNHVDYNVMIREVKEWKQKRMSDPDSYEESESNQDTRDLIKEIKEWKQNKHEGLTKDVKADYSNYDEGAAQHTWAPSQFQFWDQQRSQYIRNKEKDENDVHSEGDHDLDAFDFFNDKERVQHEKEELEK